LDFFEDFNTYNYRTHDDPTTANANANAIPTHINQHTYSGSSTGGTRVRRLSISFAAGSAVPEGPFDEHWLADPATMNQCYIGGRRPSIDYVKAMLFDETFDLKEVNPPSAPHREDACFEPDKDDLLHTTQDGFIHAPLAIAPSPSPLGALLSYENAPHNSALSVTSLMNNAGFLAQQNYLQLQPIAPLSLQIQTSPLLPSTLDSSAVPQSTEKRLPAPATPPQTLQPASSQRQSFYPIVPSPFSKGFNVANTLPINVQARGFASSNNNNSNNNNINTIVNKDVKKLLPVVAPGSPPSGNGRLPTPSKKIVKSKIITKAPPIAAGSNNSTATEHSKKGKVRVDIRRTKTARLKWTPELQEIFSATIEKLGIGAVPSTILDIMNVEGLTRENVASHLQKYRQHCIRGTTGRNKKMLKFNPDGSVISSTTTATPTPAPVLNSLAQTNRAPQPFAVPTSRPNQVQSGTPAAPTLPTASSVSPQTTTARTELIPNNHNHNNNNHNNLSEEDNILCNLLNLVGPSTSTSMTIATPAEANTITDLHLQPNQP